MRDLEALMESTLDGPSDLECELPVPGFCAALDTISSDFQQQIAAHCERCGGISGTCLVERILRVVKVEAFH